MILSPKTVIAGELGHSTLPFFVVR